MNAHNKSSDGFRWGRAGSAPPSFLGDGPTDTSSTGKFDDYRPLRSESDAAWQ